MISGRRTLSDPLDSSISGSTRVVLGVPVYNSKHKVIGALGCSYDVTALSRMLFEDLFNGQGCSMIIAQSGEIIALKEIHLTGILIIEIISINVIGKWITKTK